jgi:3-hydroxyacyl-CoA dehydrogenase
MSTRTPPEPASPAGIPGTVAVIGAGSIGTAWAIVFACAGIRVRLYEQDPALRKTALGETEVNLAHLRDAGLLEEDVAAVMGRVSIWDTLEDALDEAAYVQECVIEDLDVKRALFAELDRLTPPGIVLASSTSTIMVSRFAAELDGRERCIVVHPGNPPYFLRVAEVVPAEFTSASTIERTRELLEHVGITPVMLDREIEGFVFNRLQGALLREAYCLVRDGVISASDIDTLVREGLGRRWSLIGPFTTSELNTRGGLRRHAELIGPVYARLGVERANENPWTPENIERVAGDIELNLPHPSWEENVRERDRAMIRLAALLRDFENPMRRDDPVRRSARAGARRRG